jgi:sulfur-oxidizing protein SoxY
MIAEAQLKNLVFAAAFACVILTAPPARAQDDETARAARWQDLAQAIFGARQIQSGDGRLSLDAPDRAFDAALVPVTIHVQNPADAKSVYLVIDNNPAPLAAHITFGPAADPKSLALRVRVDQYTNMHAIEETKDGALYEAHRFVKASGGCSAPSGSYDEAALAKIGEMKLRLPDGPREDGARLVLLLIRHPNFSGMQKDPLTHGYTPARFVKTVDIRFDGTPVLHLDSDIAISADPAITFGVLAQNKGKLAVMAQDSNNAVFERVFDLGPPGS